jgi:hypothetical protein
MSSNNNESIDLLLSQLRDLIISEATDIATTTNITVNISVASGSANFTVDHGHPVLAIPVSISVPAQQSTGVAPPVLVPQLEGVAPPVLSGVAPPVLVPLPGGVAPPVIAPQHVAGVAPPARVGPLEQPAAAGNSVSPPCPPFFRSRPVVASPQPLLQPPVVLGPPLPEFAIVAPALAHLHSSNYRFYVVWRVPDQEHLQGIWIGLDSEIWHTFEALLTEGRYSGSGAQLRRHNSWSEAWRAWFTGPRPRHSVVPQLFHA